MATSNLLPLLLLLAFSLLAVTTTARPCKTLFFSITTSYYHHHHHQQNPNPNFTKLPTFFFTATTWRRSDPILTRPEPAEEESESRSLFGLTGRPSIFFRRPDPEDGEELEIRKFRPSIFFRRPDPEGDIRSSMIGKFGRPSSIYFFRRSDPILTRPDPVDFDPTRREMILTGSIRDRTKDIMRVVGSLLFGVCCGALTAATMYLIWSLFWPNSRFDFEDSDGDDFEDYDDVSAKKMGYVAIPSNKVIDDGDLKKPAAPTKEVV
ncbi:uncharacterized protein LOC132616654 [Lycium barbarum]|uniref:uncharacterized protein LOC132616654 n=1 Tax=Lycium barbarum TaxID=112863 RepID=UPI00293E2D4C|nr:uncharacterized protein LOC132616654 [Lycium barbarum]